MYQQVKAVKNLSLNKILFQRSKEFREHTCFFHALIFAGSQGSCLDTRSLGRVFKHHPRDPASLNAMKQTCVIIILAYFT